VMQLETLLHSRRCGQLQECDTPRLWLGSGVVV
jgi:hypothetical protein